MENISARRPSARPIKYGRHAAFRSVFCVFVRISPKMGRREKKTRGEKEEERNKNILIIATALHGKNSTFPRIRPFKSNCKCPSPFQFLIFLSANNYRYVKVFLLTLLSLSFFYSFSNSLYIVFLSLLSANTRLSFFFASPSLLSLFNNFPRACSLNC